MQQPVPQPVVHQQPQHVAYLEDVRPTAAVRFDDPTPLPVHKGAIAALIAVFVFPIAAIIMGHYSLHDIRHGRAGGRRTAMAATVLGYFLTLWLVVMVILGVASVFVITAGGKIIIG